jgi:cytochrome c-L
MLTKFLSARVRPPLLLAVCVMLLSFAPSLAAIEFKNALDDSPLDISGADGETLTDAVKEFHETGGNPYDGDEAALAEGKKLFNDNCQVCHGKVAEGRMCPSLVDDKYAYPRVSTDVGMFEVIYGGATGAMRAYKGRLTQDQILQVIAYVRSLESQ